jgi:integrase/recombinase XerD
MPPKMGVQSLWGKEQGMRDKVDAFLTHLIEQRGYSENTLAAYRNDLSQFMSFLSRHVSNWEKVDQKLITDYILYMKEREYASSTVARKVAAIKSFFHYLVAAGAVGTDPTATLDSPKVKKRLPRTIPATEVERLLAEPAKSSTPKALRDHALLELLYATGMRVTEAVSLDIEDVNLPSATVRVKRKKDGKERLLPLYDRAQKALERYIQKGRLPLAREPEEPALFLNHRGQRLTRQGLWLIIKAYVEEADIDAEVTPHTLRHSFATHKLKEGVALHEIQRLLGHANISTTQVYTQISSQDE